MAGKEPGILAEGCRRLWRRQRVLWWAYFVSLVLAWFASRGAGTMFGAVLDRSLAAQKLFHGFDLAVMAELANQRSVSFGVPMQGSFLATAVFFVFMVFLTGGILADFGSEKKLTTADFFQACGAFFWRLVRLLIFLGIVLAPVVFLYGGLSAVAARLSRDSADELTGFRLLVAIWAVVGLLLMVIRLWFDMAQVHFVAEGERAVRRSVWRSLKLTLKNLPVLFSLYFGISLLAWAGWFVLAWLWLRTGTPEGVAYTFLLGQLAVLLSLGTRLWQRACEVVWYERNRPVPVAVPPAVPEEPLSTPPIPASLPEPDAPEKTGGFSAPGGGEGTVPE